mmetsp:Transcript_69501/g.185012  ORF Transcript_69501/g.185012 Transcript_69501/m.185012 type:complete len:273 (-) Transcript_69501:259-1077(-)
MELGRIQPLEVLDNSDAPSTGTAGPHHVLVNRLGHPRDRIRLMLPQKLVRDLHKHVDIAGAHPFPQDQVPSTIHPKDSHGPPVVVKPLVQTIIQRPRLKSISPPGVLPPGHGVPVHRRGGMHFAAACAQKPPQRQQVLRASDAGNSCGQLAARGPLSRFEIQVLHDLLLPLQRQPLSLHRRQPQRLHRSPVAKPTILRMPHPGLQPRPLLLRLLLVRPNRRHSAALPPPGPGLRPGGRRRRRRPVQPLRVRCLRSGLRRSLPQPTAKDPRSQ